MTDLKSYRDYWQTDNKRTNQFVDLQMKAVSFY